MSTPSTTAGPTTPGPTTPGTGSAGTGTAGTSNAGTSTAWASTAWASTAWTGTAETSSDPRTGEVVATVQASTAKEVEATVVAATAAAPLVAGTSPAERRGWLHALAAALEDAAVELVPLADRETGLGRPRLEGELARTAGQLRFYGDVAVEGSYLGATLDTGTPELLKLNVPLGPIAVFGASNFPFAFSVLGNDTASALAAGCPVVVKAHPAHPSLSERLGALARASLQSAGAPDGTFGLVSGFDAGTAVVSHPGIKAVAFTGSEAGGMALASLARQREEVIPVFAEMGTVNPVVVSPAAAARMVEIAAGFVGSFTLGSGQFCTKPGLIFVPAGSDGAALVGRALEDAAPSPVMLTRGIAEGVVGGIAGLIDAGATVAAQVAVPDRGWSAPATLLSASLDDLEPGSSLLAEVFGPVAVVVEYRSVAALLPHLARLQGALAASLFHGAADPAADPRAADAGAADAGAVDPDAPALAAALAARVGRLVANGWPTGVAYTWAQHHGGPWPSTSDPSATSVGAGALDRFVRPLALQDLPEALRPPALAAGNPWSIPRRIDGVLTLPGAP